jgi:hypothetical protein
MNLVFDQARSNRSKAAHPTAPGPVLAMGFTTVALGMCGVTMFISFFLIGFSFDTIDPNGAHPRKPTSPRSFRADSHMASQN